MIVTTIEQILTDSLRGKTVELRYQDRRRKPIHKGVVKEVVLDYWYDEQGDGDGLCVTFEDGAEHCVGVTDPIILEGGE